jgi:uroporphyrinogen decarboxylase
MKYDGKHSYEDKILPVEQAYERLNPEIAVIGGLDLDFICRKTPREIYSRACGMLEKTSRRGGYALGSGNSIPDYTPYENYLAMLAAAIVN